jgi:hypothetical protein
VGCNLENWPKISTFWVTIQQKTEEHPKYRKIADSRFEFGPRVGYPCVLKDEEINLLFASKFT